MERASMNCRSRSTWMRAALVIAVGAILAPTSTAINRTLVCRPQSFWTVLTTLCVCEPCVRCHYSIFDLQCEPLSSSSGGVASNATDPDFQQPSLDPADWFLTADELTKSRGGVPRDDLLTWSDGNAVDIFTSTNKFFSSVYYDVENATAPGQILITGWEITNIPFLPKSETWDDTRFQAMIGRALDKGVNVSVLLWTNLFHPHKTSVLQSYVNSHTSGTWLFDNRLPYMTSSHHQKTIVVNNPNGRIAYVGGIDLTQDRWDNRFHNMSSLRLKRGIKSNYDGWIDASLRLQGPVVHDVAANFVGRWNENRPALEDTIEFSNPSSYLPLDSGSITGNVGNQTVPGGTVSVQLTRTYSCKVGYDFAPRGEVSILDARIKAIRRAKNYVYIEDQYFIHVPQLQDALLEVLPTIQALIIVAQEPPLATALTGFEILLYRMLNPLIDRFPGKVFAFAPRPSLALYVHSKVVIVDDVFLSVGSSNWNRRSMTSDSEVTSNLVDRTAVAHTPDGITVTSLARDFRLRKFSEFSGVSTDELSGLRTMEALERLRTSAANATSGSVVAGLQVDSSVYFHVYPNGFEDEVDPQDIC